MIVIVEVSGGCVTSVRADDDDLQVILQTSSRRTTRNCLRGSANECRRNKPCPNTMT